MRMIRGHTFISGGQVVPTNVAMTDSVDVLS